MARRRYLSTNISKDKLVNRLATEHGDFAALLYTWMVPHAEDDTTLTADPEELLYEVMPARRDKSIPDVQAALDAMLDLGLIERVGADRIGFPCESFYRYQSYISEERRRKPESSAVHQDSTGYAADQRATAQNAAEPRDIPQNSVSVNSRLTLDQASISVTSREDGIAPDGDAASNPVDEIELTDAERKIVGYVRQVRGMAAYSEVEIGRHLREVIAARGSPVSDAALLCDALKFRDYHNEKRANQPINQRWRGGMRAMTNWFSKTREAAGYGNGKRPDPASQLDGASDDDYTSGRLGYLVKRASAG